MKNHLLKVKNRYENEWDNVQCAMLEYDNNYIAIQHKVSINYWFMRSKRRLCFQSIEMYLFTVCPPQFFQNVCVPSYSTISDIFQNIKYNNNRLSWVQCVMLRSLWNIPVPYFVDISNQFNEFHWKNTNQEEKKKNFW